MKVKEVLKYKDETDNLLVMFGVLEREERDGKQWISFTDGFLECLATNYEEVEDFKTKKWNEIDEEIRTGLVLFTLCSYIDVKQGYTLLKSGRLLFINRYIRSFLDAMGGLKK